MVRMETSTDSKRSHHKSKTITIGEISCRFGYLDCAITMALSWCSALHTIFSSDLIPFRWAWLFAASQWLKFSQIFILFFVSFSQEWNFSGFISWRHKPWLQHHIDWRFAIGRYNPIVAREIDCTISAHVHQVSAEMNAKSMNFRFDYSDSLLLLRVKPTNGIDVRIFGDRIHYRFCCSIRVTGNSWRCLYVAQQRFVRCSFPNNQY